MTTIRKGLWMNVILWFVLGDIITTFYGLTNSNIQETGPVAIGVITLVGVWPLILLKITFTGVLFRIYLEIHHLTLSIGIPIGLSAIGIYATLWNFYVISIATGQIG